MARMRSLRSVPAGRLVGVDRKPPAGAPKGAYDRSGLRCEGLSPAGSLLVQSRNLTAVSSGKSAALLARTERDDELNQAHGCNNVQNYCGNSDSHMPVRLVELMQSVQRI